MLDKTIKVSETKAVPQTGSSATPSTSLQEETKKTDNASQSKKVLTLEKTQAKPTEAELMQLRQKRFACELSQDATTIGAEQVNIYIERIGT